MHPNHEAEKQQDDEQPPENKYQHIMGQPFHYFFLCSVAITRC